MMDVSDFQPISQANGPSLVYSSMGGGNELYEGQKGSQTQMKALGIGLRTF